MRASREPTLSTTLEPDATATPILDVLGQHMRRVIQDALAEASASYWTARAAQFEAARPRRGDYRGTATREQLVERDERCQAIAAACRARAQLTDELRPQERRIIDEEVLSG